MADKSDTSPGSGIPRHPPRLVTARVSPAAWVSYFAGLDAGMSKAESARAAGISEPTAYLVHKDPTRSSGLEFYKQWLTSERRDVTDPKNLSREARKGMADFEYFRQRYFGHLSLPWHVKTAEIIQEHLATKDKEFLCINMPPGTGKSTLVTHDIPVWLGVKNRGLRTLIGTGAATTGTDYTVRIKNSFDRILPLEADDHDKMMGLAVDGTATLLADYGRFRPLDGGYWRNDKMVLAKAGGAPAHQKEASFVSYGQKSGFLGGRYNLVIWDDVVTDANARTPIQQAELARWWKSTAESRLEPGGVLILMGQRMGAHDLYRHVLDIKDISDALDDDEYDIESLPRKYTHIVFPAHDDTNCKGGDSKHKDHNPDTAKPWPKGCLLDPKRVTYKDLRVIEFNDPKTYATVYQQRDTDAGSVLVNPLWIKGGEDASTGIFYPGCWDTERHLGELPQNLAGDIYSVVTIDPSPSQYWGCIWWLYQVDTDFHHLIDLERKKMTAPLFLDYNHATRTYSGIAENWWQQSKEAGKPITHIIVESNAAQKFILQYEHAKQWSMLRGVDLVSHDTKHFNKADKNFGVEALAPHYRHGKVRLPGHWVTRKPVLALYDEVTRYPDSATDDLVMSHWFLLWQAPRLFVPKMTVPYKFKNRPEWLAKNARRGIRGVVA